MRRYLLFFSLSQFFLQNILISYFEWGTVHNQNKQNFSLFDKENGNTVFLSCTLWRHQERCFQAGMDTDWGIMRTKTT